MLVIDASVVSGSISDSDPMKVVFPTPNPPAMMIFTGTGGRRRTTGWGASKGTDTIDQPLQEGHVVGLPRHGGGGLEQPLPHQVADDDQRHHQRDPDPGGH